MNNKQRGFLGLAILLIWVVLAWASYSGAASTLVPRDICAYKLASQTNPKLMNYQTSLRRTRALCDRIKADDHYLFRALTQ